MSGAVATLCGSPLPGSMATRRCPAAAMIAGVTRSGYVATRQPSQAADSSTAGSSLSNISPGIGGTPSYVTGGGWPPPARDLGGAGAPGRPEPPYPGQQPQCPHPPCPPVFPSPPYSQT